MNTEALVRNLGALRDEYRAGMNAATDHAQRFAQTEQMDRVSEWSSRSERLREAFHALNRAIAIVEVAITTGARNG